MAVRACTIEAPFPLCHMPDAILGVSQHDNEDNVIVTVQSTAVHVYNVPDQKCVTSWAVSPSTVLTHFTVQHPVSKLYYTVDNYKTLRSWQDGIDKIEAGAAKNVCVACSRHWLHACDLGWVMGALSGLPPFLDVVLCVPSLCCHIRMCRNAHPRRFTPRGSGRRSACQTHLNLATRGTETYDVGEPSRECLDRREPWMMTVPLSHPLTKSSRSLTRMICSTATGYTLCTSMRTLTARCCCLRTAVLCRQTPSW